MSERKALLVRFSDFLDEATPVSAPADAVPSAPSSPAISDQAIAAPAHQHLLGPPPNPGGGSAFAELFGTTDAVDAIIVPRANVARNAPAPTVAGFESDTSEALSTTLQALEATRVEELVPLPAEGTIDDDFLPTRGMLTMKSQPRAWSRGRSKR